MTDIILLSIMIFMFTAYVGFIWLKYGVQTSISDSYYSMPRNLQWLFTIATWGYAFPAVMIGVPYSGLAFLAGAAICFVGASPAFKGGGLENTVHMVGAIVGITASQIFITFILGQWWLSVGFLLLSIITFFLPKFKLNRIWWIEIYAFVCMVISYSLLIF